jgi:thioredoxin-dependent peroxiredoxin
MSVAARAASRRPVRSNYAAGVVSEGEPAPDFTVETDAGETVSLSDFRGKRVVLYFYPKDDTPGCTAQARGIRDAYAEFESAGAVVLGVSPDDVRQHVKFKEKYNLPFTLLADPEHVVAESYGVWGEKRYMGRTYMGVSRTTFLISPDGTVAKVMQDVKPDAHADDVLKALSAA